ncbi:MAG: LPS assembly lipoprotein LptE [Deltaproteobacteria bacterium]
MPAGQARKSPLSRARGGGPGRGVTALLATLALAACGYRFAADGGPLPKRVRGVDVPTLKNETTELDVSAWLTQALRRELERSGHGGGPGAEARLEGTIETVSGSPLALKTGPTLLPDGRPIQGPMGQTILGPANPGLYSAQVTVTVKLWRGAELLSELDHFQLQEPYLPSDDLPTMDANRRLALRRLAKNLGREIVARLEAAP